MWQPIAALLDGLSLSVLRAPSQRRALPTADAFWCAALLSVLVDLVLNRILVYAPEAFYIDGLINSLFEIVKIALFAWLLALLVKRRALMWALATWLLVAGTLVRLIVSIVIASNPSFSHQWILFNEVEFAPAFGLGLFFIAWRMWAWLEPKWPWWRALPLALATALPLALAYVPLPYRLFYYYGAEPNAETASDEDEFEGPVWPSKVYAETLFAEQSERMDSAIAALEPQRPGHVDLYLLAIGGYAGEDVFRNEVHFVQSQFDQRFGTRGRSLTLLNHVDALEESPLATQRNIDRALAGIANRIDPDEDIVFVFITTHGSADHQLSIELAGMPLQQVTPDSLSSSIREAGIRWRVAVVSACYSGGYIKALSASTALVLTAARKDRTSFGCGADSDITYFGRAYFSEALNQTSDFIAAFEIAKDAIAVREEDLDGDPSEPQIASTPLIQAKLAEWRSQLKLGPPLAFKKPTKP